VSILVNWSERDVPHFPGRGEQTALAGCTDVMDCSLSGASMAQNEDVQPELDGQCFMVEVQPDEGVGSTSFYSPGLLPGRTLGWNSAGWCRTSITFAPMTSALVCRGIYCVV